MLSRRRHINIVPANGDLRGCRINKSPTGCRTAGRQSIRILDKVSVSFLHFERFGNINICRTLRPERKFSGQTLLPLSMSSLAFRPPFVRMIACGRPRSRGLRPLRVFSVRTGRAGSYRRPDQDVRRMRCELAMALGTALRGGPRMTHRFAPSAHLPPATASTVPPPRLDLH